MTHVKVIHKVKNRNCWDVYRPPCSLRATAASGSSHYVIGAR